MYRFLFLLELHTIIVPPHACGPLVTKEMVGYQKQSQSLTSNQSDTKKTKEKRLEPKSSLNPLSMLSLPMRW